MKKLALLCIMQLLFAASASAKETRSCDFVLTGNYTISSSRGTNTYPVAQSGAQSATEIGANNARTKARDNIYQKYQTWFINDLVKRPGVVAAEVRLLIDGGGAHACERVAFGSYRKGQKPTFYYTN